MTDDLKSRARKVAALAQGDYDERVAAAISAGVSPDEFLADLMTFEAHTPVLIEEGHTLTAGEILFQTRTATATPGGSNVGNGTLSIDSLGPNALEGSYTLSCTAVRSNGGIFQLHAPDGSIVAPINTGTPYTTDELSLTIADGSTDFAIDDSFSIAVTTSGDFAPYAFETLSLSSVQAASAVLSLDVDTSSGALEQFATASGPAILPPNFARLPPKPDSIDVETYNDILAVSLNQLSTRGIVCRGAVPVAEQIKALSQGDYQWLVDDAIATNASSDQFWVDLHTIEAREPVTIATGQQLKAGEILFRSISTSVTWSGNVGDGLLTVDSAGIDVVDGAYTVVCTAFRTNRGLFELRAPDGGVIAAINVGTPLVSDHLNLTIADGAIDFVPGDAFQITVSGSGSYAAYKFDSSDVQIASAVLSMEVDTTAGAAEQFATARGPAILESESVHLATWNAAAAGAVKTIDAYNALLLRSVEQLAERGMVLRGPPPILVES